MILKGFEKVFLKKGETKAVSITLDNEAFSYYDEELKQFAVKNGVYQVAIGTSLENIIHQFEFFV
jgi:beta-glucosidase